MALSERHARRTRQWRLRGLGVVLSLVAAMALQVRSAGQSASSSPRVQPNEVVYLGAFQTPPADGLLYGGTALTFNPLRNSLILSGWSGSGASGEHGSAEVTIPALGGVASFLQPLSPTLEGQIATIGDDEGNGRSVGGQLVYNNKLYISAFLYYDAQAPQQAVSHFSRPLDFAVRGQLAGPVAVGPMQAGFYSGYMATVPSEWQAALGGPAVTGQCCLSIVSRTSYGPGLFAFNPERPGSATPLVYYDTAHQTLAAYGAPGSNPIFNGTTRVTGVALPQGTSSTLFFGTTGVGNWCYGTGPDCGDPMDPGSKGDHAYPYVGYVWAYDNNELAAVHAGTKQPWEVQPYATWPLTWTNVGNNFSSGGVAYDPQTQRLYVLQVGGSSTGPLIHVYQVTTAGGSVTTADTVSPTVSVTAPGNGATLAGSAAIGATASDNVGVSQVWFTIDNAPLGGTLTAAPYQASWSTTAVSNGTHVLRAVAQDAAGNTTTSSPVTVTINNGTVDTQAPAVSITAPSGGTTLSKSVVVTAAASDNVGVASVQLTLDGANFGAALTAAPYTTTWNTTTVSNGSHTLRAVARDAAGNASTSAGATVTVSNGVVDTTAPTVSLTAPAAGSTLVGLVSVSANASDSVGVVGVQFTVDGKNLGLEDTAAPYAISWDTTTIVNGSHTVRAVARDAAGNVRTSSGRTVAVNNPFRDTEAPTLTLIAPVAGSTVSGSVTVQAATTDNVGTVGVRFFLDGVLLGTEDLSAPFQATWATTGTLNGSHTISATARDAAGNTTAAALQVTVKNLGTSVAGDFNGDGQADLLFANTNGQLYTWAMNGASLAAGRALTPSSVNPVWQVVGIDDFNGDRKSDILWQKSDTGELYVWFMDGATMTSGVAIASRPLPWRVAATADIDGDGQPDVVWQQPVTGDVTAWLMNGVTQVTEIALGRNDHAWRIAAAADLNRDGKADLVWQNGANGQLAAWLLQGTTVTVVPFGAVDPAWQIRAVADFNRDGLPDLIWQHAFSGQLYVWYLNGTTMTRSEFLSPGQVSTAWQIVGQK